MKRPYSLAEENDWEDVQAPYAVPLVTVCTFLSKCECANRGHISNSQLRRLKKKNYDQVPVRVKDSEIGWRLIAVDQLEKLSKRGQELTASTTYFLERDLMLVSSHEPQLIELLRGMATRDAAILYQPPEVDEEGSYTLDGLLFGLLTIADLNGKQIRRAAYEVILDLETQLGRLLSYAVPEPWDWVKKLSNDGQVQILGYWEISKRNNKELNPVAVATLPHLLKAVRDSSGTFPMMKYRSKKAFDKDTGGLVNLRNNIMHPVRPLVLSKEDVSKMARQISTALELKAKVENALKSYS